jgi:predicted TIM-barrel fold metal-dependent hydrolase
MVYAPNQLAEIGRIATRHPDLKLIVDHLGQPRVTPEINHAEHLDVLVQLADLPNVAVKASAMPQYSHEPYPFRDMHAHVCRALEAFGPHRTFWGSDLTRLKDVSYRQAVTMFTEDLACLAPDDQELVMGRALCEWIGWPTSVC